MASDNEYLEIVKYLLEHNAPIDTEAIYTASFNGYLEIVKYLLEHNAPIDGSVI